MSEPTQQALRILIVEDEPTVARSLRRALARAGREVIVCGNPTEALAHMDTPGFIAPDVVFSDVRMPDMHGPNMLRVIRPRLPRACFVIMSGADQDIAQEAIEAGVADLFVPKPWDPDRVEVYLAMAQAIQHQRRAAETAPRNLSAPCSVVVMTSDITLGTFLRCMAAARKHRVTIAKHAGDALELLRRGTVEILMAGVGMEGELPKDRSLLDVARTNDFFVRAEAARFDSTYQIGLVPSLEALREAGVREENLAPDRVVYLEGSGEALYAHMSEALQEAEDTFMRHGAG